MPEQLEKRMFVLDVAQLRASKVDKGTQLTGYAAVFNSLSENLGGFRERIKPGAFTRTLREKADVRALINHDPSMVLGRSTKEAGTLRMSEDDIGLKTTIDMPDTQYARDLLVSLERKDVTGMSFGFYTRSDNWLDDRDGLIRELLDVDLFDVSVVTYPAYTATTVSERSLTARDQHLRSTVAASLDEVKRRLALRRIAAEL